MSARKRRPDAPTDAEILGLGRSARDGTITEVIADLVHQLALAALAEAQGNPRLLEREGALFWRALGGFMYGIAIDDRPAAPYVTLTWSTP